MRARLLVPCLAALALPALAAEKAAEPTGIAAFSRHARFVDAQISPKGSYLAVVSTENGRRSLAFVELATRKISWGIKADDHDMVSDFMWASDGRVIAELVGSEGHLAEPVSRGELYAVEPGKAGRLIFGYRAGEDQVGSRIRKAGPQYAWGRLLARIPGDDRRILIETRSWDDAGDRFVSVQKMDIHTGLTELVTVGPIAGTRFLADEQGEVRIAWGWDRELKPRYYHREPGGTWSEVHLKRFAEGAWPMRFVGGDRTLYVADGAEKGFGVYAADLAGGDRKLLLKTEIAPPRLFGRDRVTGRILFVESEPDLPAWEFVDGDHPFSKTLKGLLASHPDDHVRFLNATDDGKQAVFHVFSDRNPGQFLLVDVEKQTAEVVAETRPWIRPEAMAEQTAFHIKASDGLWIHGYVTLPRGQPAGKPPPMVVLPHGGPHGPRNHWGFDHEVQLLASHGFAVLQVNFRGSGGYGQAYEEAGYRHWGDRMIEDLLDATRWAVKKGHADPVRICAYGGSFGAYAAMQAAILAPDLIRCAAGAAGVYDLVKVRAEARSYYSERTTAFVERALGSDKEKLAADSPVNHAARLKARVLLIHGGEDKRAPIEHAEALRDALTKAGRPPEWLVEPKEGHGFYDEKARERMYTRLVAFLKENTAAVAAAAPQAATSAEAAPAPAAAAPAR